MRTQTTIENNRRWAVLASVTLLIVYSLMAIGYGYLSLFKIVVGNGWLVGHVVTTLVMLLCLVPGVILWKVLRPRSKYAAMYGLLVAAACCIIPHRLLNSAAR